MQQLLYVSTSLIGKDVPALDRLMVEARTNNALDGITGLLWTDGERFAQVLEGEEASIAALLVRLRQDSRHTNFEIVHDVRVEQRQFGEWSMTRPANDLLAAMYEQRMRAQLAWLGSQLSVMFDGVIAGSRRPILG